MPDNPPRLVPDYPFPPYAYVPGHFPHPFSDPSGHSFGVAPDPIEPLEAETWPQSRSYLIGIDLFNFGYYWEAHEVWERLWRVAGRTGTTATFLKGLIKLAAAGVKRRERRGGAGTSHPRRARKHFEQVRSGLPDGRTTYAGLSLVELTRFAEQAQELAGVPIGGPSKPVEIVFPFALLPQTLE